MAKGTTVRENVATEAHAFAEVLWLAGRRALCWSEAADAAVQTLKERAGGTSRRTRLRHCHRLVVDRNLQRLRRRALPVAARTGACHSDRLAFCS